MGWHDKTTVKKGSIGEKIVHKWLRSKGYVIYLPDEKIDKPHWVDRMVCDERKQVIFVAEAKTKERRKYYRDTGFNVSQFDDYNRISQQHKMDVFVFWVDAKIQKVYGNWLSTLKKGHTDKKGKLYPRYETTSNGEKIVYFHLDQMQDVALLTDAQCAEIRKYSTVSKRYCDPQPKACDDYDFPF